MVVFFNFFIVHGQVFFKLVLLHVFLNYQAIANITIKLSLF